MRARLGEVELCYELLGPVDAIPIILIAGVYQQLSSWPQPFIDALTGSGMRVLIFDNRDVGHSSRERGPAPSLGAVLGGDLTGVNYMLSDMATDAAALVRAEGGNHRRARGVVVSGRRAATGPG